MPQLNPSPWLMILLISWGVLLILIPLKILAHRYPNNVNPITSSSTKTTSWDWPWL